jgi:cyclase
MTKPGDSGETGLSRREAIRLGMGALVGISSMVAGGGELDNVWAQGPPSVVDPITRDPLIKRAGDDRFPQPPSWKTELRQLAPNVYAYVQGGGPGINSPGVSNAGLIAGPDFLMAIDALQAPIPAKSFIAAARKATGKSFGRLINTHHHGDHVSGNQFFVPAEILSHPYCRQEVLKTVATTPKMWQKQEGLAEGTEERKVVPPMTTFEDNVTYHIGDTVVEFHFAGPAHTWGDIVAYLPQHKILFAGDIAFFYVAPYAHNGYVTKWIEQVDKILKMDVAVIVPGHGPVAGKKELAEMGEYLRLLKAGARKRYDAGMSAGKAAAEIRLGRFDNWLGPERIVMDTARLYDEFKGTLTPDINVEGIRQANADYNAAKSAAAKRG